MSEQLMQSTLGLPAAQVLQVSRSDLLRHLSRMDQKCIAIDLSSVADRA